IISASVDETVRLWEMGTGQELRQFLGHSDTVRSVAISPNGRYFVTSGYDNVARIWNRESGTEVTTLIGHSDPLERSTNGAPLEGGYVYDVQWSTDGQYVLTGATDGTARLWDVFERQFIGHDGSVV